MGLTRHTMINLWILHVLYYFNYVPRCHALYFSLIFQIWILSAHKRCVDLCLIKCSKWHLTPLIVVIHDPFYILWWFNVDNQQTVQWASGFHEMSMTDSLTNAHKTNAYNTNICSQNLLSSVFIQRFICKCAPVKYYYVFDKFSEYVQIFSKAFVPTSWSWLPLWFSHTSSHPWFHILWHYEQMFLFH